MGKSLPKDKTLDWSKLKTFAGNETNDNPKTQMFWER